MSTRLQLLLAATLALVTAPAVQAQIDAQSRAVSVSATILVPGPWEDQSDSDSDGAATLLGGAFDHDLEVDALVTAMVSSADAYQFSDVDAASDAFCASGSAAASIYVQGEGTADASSSFELTLHLTGAATLELDGDLTGTNSFEGFFSHDDHGSALCEVRLVDLTTQATVFLRQVGVGQYDLLDGTSLLLAAGHYRLRISATATDATSGVEQVNGSMAAAIYDVQGRITGPGSLEATPEALSLGTGGVQALALDAGAVHAGRPYLVVGSASGAAPGLLVDGVAVPLQIDAYTVLALQLVNGPVFQSTFSLLDGAGTAAASIALPAGLSPGLVGQSFHHAFVVFHSTGSLAFASNPAALVLQP